MAWALAATGKPPPNATRNESRIEARNPSAAP